MKLRIASILLLVILSKISFGQENPTLLKIEHRGKFGFIDSTGRMVIPAIYWNASDFVEGLAAVREKGLFGYINKKGDYVIQPEFEYACTFKEGKAIVFNHGIPRYINKYGQTCFRTKYDFLNNFEDGRAIVQMESYNQGLINTSGKIILDTFYRIKKIERNRYLVEEFCEDSSSLDNFRQEFAIVDSAGIAILPFGILDLFLSITNRSILAYNRIVDERARFELVKYDLTNQTKEIINDSVNSKEFQTVKSKYLEELISHYKKLDSISHKPSFEDIFDKFIAYCLTSDTCASKIDWINPRLILITYDNWMDKSYCYYTNGKLLSSKYQEIYSYDEKGKCKFKVDDKWGIMDQQTEKVIEANNFPEDNCLEPINELYKARCYNFNNDRINNHYTIFDTSDEIILKPISDPYYPSCYFGNNHSSSLFNKLFNKNLDLIWAYLDRNYKKRSNFDRKYYLTQDFKYSEVVDHQSLPEILLKEVDKKKQDSIILFLEEIPTYNSSQQGSYTNLFLYLNKGEIFENKTEFDSNLGLLAKDQNGDWRMISSIDNLGCVIPHEDLYISTGEAVKYFAPIPGGATKTKMKYVYYEYLGDQNYKIISNSQEFDAGVNPATFWRTRRGFSSNEFEPDTFEWYSFKMDSIRWK